MARKPSSGSIYRPKYRRPDGNVVESQVWWLKFYRNGAPIRESSKTESWEEACRLLKKRQGEIVTGRFAGLAPERVCMGELLKAVEADYIENERKSLVELQGRLRKHLLPAVQEVRAVDFGSSHLKRYIAARRRGKAVNATINRELATLSRAFHLAAATDPPLVLRIPHIPKLPEDNVREGFLEHSQYQAVLDALPPHLRCLFVVAYHVGCRSGELRSIQPSQVDVAAKQIRLAGTQTKNGRPRTLPIYGDMETWLEWQLDDLKANWRECQWLFHFNGRHIGNHLGGWREACKEAGLASLLFHDLRRTAVRNMERAGIPRSVAMAISGHLTESVYRRYDIVSARDLGLAAAKLDAYFREQTALPKSTIEPSDGQSNGQSSRGAQQGSPSNLLN